MKTTNKDKIEKAKRLLKLVNERKALEKEEQELKSFFKAESKDGLFEAGNVIIMIETKSRTSLDRDGLSKILGDKIKEFEKVTQYEQVIVKEKAA